MGFANVYRQDTTPNAASLVLELRRLERGRRDGASVLFVPANSSRDSGSGVSLQALSSSDASPLRLEAGDLEKARSVHRKLRRAQLCIAECKQFTRPSGWRSVTNERAKLHEVGMTPQDPLLGREVAVQLR